MLSFCDTTRFGRREFLRVGGLALGGLSLPHLYGGTKPGVVHGTTDKIAGFPTDHPVTAGDLVSTVYHLVGVDPEAMVPDHTNRPTHISHGGKPIQGILN